MLLSAGGRQGRQGTDRGVRERRRAVRSADILLDTDRTNEQLSKATDTADIKLGDFKVTFGNLVGEIEKGSLVTPPAWRPEGIRNVGVE